MKKRAVLYIGVAVIGITVGYVQSPDISLPLKYIPLIMIALPLVLASLIGLIYYFVEQLSSKRNG